MSVFDKSAAELSSLVGQKTQLLEKPSIFESILNMEFNFCSHAKGFWAGQNKEVGDYMILSGVCKKCDELVFSVQERANTPA
jgi:hypothetical protein